MDGNHPKINVDPRPKRRRDRDNPYEIFTVGKELPAVLTYPNVSPLLYAEAEKLFAVHNIK